MNEQFQALIKRWESALESYGTPRTFADNSYAEVFDPLTHGELPLRVIFNEGFVNRRALMENQKQENEKRKAQGLPLRWTNDGSPCFLCDNVGQAQDIGNNLILPFNTFEESVLFPNKYPLVKGAMLLSVKEHNPNGTTYNVTSTFLEHGVEIAENYDLSLLRNHPKAGMSITGHEHFQLHPMKIRRSSGGETYFTGLVNVSLTPTDFGGGIFRVNGTRFDTLALRGPRSLEQMFKLVESLNKYDKIYTFSYNPQGTEPSTFFIAIHLREDEKRRIGGGHHMYLDAVPIGSQVSPEAHFKEKEPFFHRPGTFNWQNYIRE